MGGDQEIREYLLGARFEVYTDNNPLCYLKSAKLGALEMRWAAQLAQFDFSMKYRSGKANGNADGLSRQVARSHDDQAVGVEKVLSDVTGTTSLNAIRKDGVKKSGVSGNQEAVMVSVESIMVTSTLPGYSKEELAKGQKEDAVLQRVLWWWRGGNKPTTRPLSKEEVPVRKLLNKWDKLVDREGVLCLIVSDTDLEENCVLVVPSAMKTWLLEYLHDRAGHQEKERTLALLKK
jgi:hypothetical protein